MQLIQVVTGLPPKIDGIGDYALKLARRLRDEHATETRFLVIKPEWSGGPIDGFPVVVIGGRTPEAFRESIRVIESQAQCGPLPLLVHFSVYGFQKRGCPFWFATALEEFHRERPDLINVAFHELEIHAWQPWRSAFWVPRIQRSIIKRIARVAKFRYTNTEPYRIRLEEWGVGPNALIPNFSVFEEPFTNPSFVGRHNQLLIFGQTVLRRMTYERTAGAIELVCRRIGVKRILDVGDPVPESCMPRIDGVEVMRCGRLTWDEVNAHMRQSIATFMQYPFALLTKSSVYTASSAFGTIPFVYDKGSARDSYYPLVTGEDFVPVGREGPLLKLPMDVLSQKVFDNYQKRRSSWIGTRTIVQNLVDCVPGSPDGNSTARQKRRYDINP